MKEIIKRILPKKWVEKHSLYKLKRRYMQHFEHDILRYNTYSGLWGNKRKENLLGRISLRAHVLEKGLTMPDMRLGFGKDNLLDLIRLCLAYKCQYGSDNEILCQAVGVIREYRNIHIAQQYKLDQEVQEQIDCLVNHMPEINATQQDVYTAKEYYEYCQASFELFSQSRHSLRNFSTIVDVSVADIVEAIELAQNAPSSCNRQSSRVHIVAEKVLIEKVLALQNGNRGFGHLVSKLLVLTVDLSCYNGIKERNLCYIDSGIYTMNLLYALHYQQIGACTLNWCDSPEDDEQIRSLLNIPASETITLLIACGKAPEVSFKVASSPRVKAQNIVTIHTK